MAQGQPDEALQLLGRMYRIAYNEGRMGRVIESLALTALALRAQVEDEKAITSLAGALSLAEPEGYVRVFADEGQPMTDLLGQLARRGLPESAYARQVINASGRSSRQLPSPAGQAGSDRSSDALSERELEVLRLIGEGLSNREIADRLVISLPTVKKHIENIHGKLAVHSRTQALARARELGLF